METDQKNHSLTQRIVGAIVLISLGIIFIPLFLETDKINPGIISQSPIPEIPGEISTIVFQLNEKSGKFEEQGSSKSKEFSARIEKEMAETQASIEVTEEESDAKTEPLVQEASPTPIQPSTPNTSEKITNTWVLQLASFKDKKNAVALRDKIRDRGFASHLNEQKVSNGSIWRVRVGPELRKSRIKEIQKILDEEFLLKSLLIRRR